ncbi:MAG: threonylcarbamoyl-AMP synthase [Clostridia bacterium]|nr:threonylcarbamoyl-AMP synthase [Clostridia bacterium]
MKTEIIKIDPDNITPSLSDIKRAAEILKSGGLVVFPTETVYGLGGDATNPASAEKIFSAKGRPKDNPLIIHIENAEDAALYAKTTPLYYRLAEKFMPGPLTVILESKDTVPYQTRGGLETVAVRCPENPVARAFISLAGVAVAAPSANLSGSPSPTNASHVIDDMYGRVDVIIDGGECDFGLESTIVKIENENTVTLLRPGKITLDELSLVCNVNVASAVVSELKAGEIALSPGMKYRHYAPASPVRLLDGERDDVLKYVKEQGNNKFAILVYSEDKDYFAKQLPSASLYELGSIKNESAQAHELFKILRDADKESFDVIYAPLPKAEGIGLALYNRLIRAAAHTIVNLRAANT